MFFRHFLIFNCYCNPLNKTTDENKQVYSSERIKKIQFFSSKKFLSFDGIKKKPIWQQIFTFYQTSVSEQENSGNWQDCQDHFQTDAIFQIIFYLMFPFFSSIFHLSFLYIFHPISVNSKTNSLFLPIIISTFIPDHSPTHRSKAIQIIL